MRAKKEVKGKEIKSPKKEIAKKISKTSTIKTKKIIKNKIVPVKTIDTEEPLAAIKKVDVDAEGDIHTETSKDMTEVQNIAEEYIGYARGMKSQQGFLLPIVLGLSKENTIFPIEISLETEEEKEKVASMMEVVACISKAVFLIFDSFILETKNKKDLEKSVRNHPDSTSAIICFAYMSNKASFRMLHYIEEKDGSNKFYFDTGWKSANKMKGRFSNPYLRIKK